MALPLEGITVVSLEQAVAAPFATRQLADMGARVVKVERPGAGDFARSYDAVVQGLSSHFVWINRSKESIALDLNLEDAREVLNRLLEMSNTSSRTSPLAQRSVAASGRSHCVNATLGSSCATSPATALRSRQG
jgi:hypothetical protein